MLRYPISTLLYLAKINIKDKIQDALKLHNNIDIRVEAKVIDKNGKIIKVHKQKSHSFLMNFLALLTSAFVNKANSIIGYYYFKSTSGAWFSDDGSNTNLSSFLLMNDTNNDSTYGIVVGTGTATPTPNDDNLGNQIVNGTGSGQLVYGAHSINPAPGTSQIQGQSTKPTSGILTPSGNTTSWQISRTFQNQSGASITVSEVGILVNTRAYSADWIYVLIIHDLLSSAITIPNGGVMAITYTISVTT